MAGAGWVSALSAVVIPSVTTGSAYSAYDAVGSSFKLPNLCGNRGGIAYTLNLVDRGTANANLDLMLFSSAFTPSTDGATFEIADADEKLFLGSIQFNSWLTGGTAKNYCCVTEPGVAIFAISGNRNIYGQFRTRATPTWGDSANPLMLMGQVVLD